VTENAAERVQAVVVVAGSLVEPPVVRARVTALLSETDVRMNPVRGELRQVGFVARKAAIVVRMTELSRVDAGGCPLTRFELLPQLLRYDLPRDARVR